MASRKTPAGVETVGDGVRVVSRAGERVPAWARGIEWYAVEVEFIEPLLATTPSDAATWEEWVRPAQAERAERAGEVVAPAQAEEQRVYVQREALAAATARTRAQADAAAGRDEDFVADEHPRQMTLFPHDAHGPFLWDYQMRGHLRELANAVKEEMGIKAFRAKLSAGLVVRPRRIYLRGTLTEPIRRPLRAYTPQGERVAIAESQAVMAGARALFYLGRLPLMDRAVSWDVLRDLLDWGEIRGMGQWRTGGWGIYSVVGWQRATTAPPHDSQGGRGS